MKPSELRTDRRMIEEMARRIVKLADPEKIILFGSHAAGRNTSDSDVDLLVVESAPFGPERSRRKEIGRLLTALRDIPTPKDVLLYSRSEFDRWRHARNHIIARAVREGKVLYERQR